MNSSIFKKNKITENVNYAVNNNKMVLKYAQ